MTGLEVLELLVALGVSAGILVAIAWTVWWLDRYDREPVHLMLAAFAWGAVAAPVVCVVIGPVLTTIGAGTPASEAMMVLGAPIIEELAKAIGVLLIAWRSGDFDNPTDGLVYGAAAGLGFATTENAAYCLGAAGGSAALVPLVLQRVVGSAGLHALASSAFGGFVGVAALSRGRLRRVAWVCVGVVVATLLHVAWNAALVRAGLAGPGPWWWLAVPGAAIAWLAILASFLESERRIIRDELRLEVELGVLPSWVVEVIPSYRRRIRSDWWPDRRERAVISRLLTRLAFRKHAVARLPVDRSRLAGIEVVWLRDRARRILDTPVVDD
jgi:RsiW-degrading membrane proteinase PrsW (M82 family)